jgi:hypothetical protein
LACADLIGWLLIQAKRRNTTQLAPSIATQKPGSSPGPFIMRGYDNPSDEHLQIYPTPAITVRTTYRTNSPSVAEFEDQQPMQPFQGTQRGATQALFPLTKVPRSLLNREHLAKFSAFIISLAFRMTFQDLTAPH